MKDEKLVEEAFKLWENTSRLKDPARSQSEIIRFGVMIAQKTRQELLDELEKKIEKMIVEKVKEKENLDRGIRDSRKKELKNRTKMLHNRVVRKRSRINTLKDVKKAIASLRQDGGEADRIKEMR